MDSIWLEVGIAIAGAVLAIVVLRYGEDAFRKRLGPAPPRSTRERQLQQEVRELRQSLDAERDARNRMEVEYEQRTKLLESRLDFLLEQLQNANYEIGLLKSQRTLETGTESLPVRRDRILVAITDPIYEIDLAVFRKVQSRTGLRFTRMTNATLTKLEGYLERARMSRRPVRYVHLAAHAGDNIVAFQDQDVDGITLSSHLAGVDVLFLSTCQGLEIGAFLGVVQYVVALAEDVENHDAALLAEAFWMEIGAGADPEDAFDRALEMAPPVVAEFAHLYT